MTSTKDVVAAQLRVDRSWEGTKTPEHHSAYSGWNSDHPFLTEGIKGRRSHVVVEVGVWKGGSTITMAREMAATGADGVVVAVDTFLGSAEHYLNPEWRSDLRLSGGRPRILEDFLDNIAQSGVADYVIPLCLDSVNAAHLFQQAGVTPDVVHIDAGHDYESVSMDLDLWFGLLRPGGTMVCDDYNADWPDVVRAVDAFTLRNDVHDFRALGAKCRFMKDPALEASALGDPRSTADEVATLLALSQEERTEAVRRLTALEREHEEVLNSRSWRWTRPLRFLSRH